MKSASAAARSKRSAIPEYTARIRFAASLSGFATVAGFARTSRLPRPDRASTAGPIDPRVKTPRRKAVAVAAVRGVRVVFTNAPEMMGADRP
jgi:hypothetical protein